MSSFHRAVRDRAGDLHVERREVRQEFRRKGDVAASGRQVATRAANRRSSSHGVKTSPPSMPILQSIVGPPRSVAYVGLRCFACVAGQTAPRYFKMLTARATTKAMVSRATADWSSMSIFAHRDSGIVSVGLKATALVNDT